MLSFIIKNIIARVKLSRMHVELQTMDTMNAYCQIESHSLEGLYGSGCTICIFLIPPISKLKKKKKTQEN